MAAPSTNGYTDVEEKISFEDVEIDIGWGMVRGKKRGTGNTRILAVHGWLDNANSFDFVYPYLDTHCTFLAIDLPGHGKSDHLGNGFIYDPRGYVGAVKKVVDKLQWDRFIYLGHSIGALAGIMFAATFPENLICLISLDIIQPWCFKPESYAKSYKKYFVDYFKQEDIYGKVPLEYEEEELITKVIESSKSLDRSSAKHLLKRGTIPSKCGSKMLLSRDVRAKTYFIGFIPYDAWVEMVRSITFPTFIIKSSDGRHPESLDDYKEVLEAFAENCPNFKILEAPGKHHVHMTHPEFVGQKITEFMKLSNCI